MRLTLIAPLSALALLSAGVAASEPYELEYQDAMRCSALHSFYAAISEDQPEAKAKHEDVAIRWLTLAMARDGEDGERALKEHEPVVEMLVERVNGMEDDPEALNAFLNKAFNTCEEMQQAYAAEFDAVEVE